MPIIYRDIADMINKRNFKVIVNETYQPVIHPLFLKEDAPPPVYAPGPMDENNKCISMVPISYIIDMMSNGTEFSLYNRDDVFEITELLRMYIETYEEYINQSRDVEQMSFMKHAKETYKIMQDRVERRRRQMKRPPAPKSITDIILSLLDGGGSKK